MIPAQTLNISVAQLLTASMNILVTPQANELHEGHHMGGIQSKQPLRSSSLSIIKAYAIKLWFHSWLLVSLEKKSLLVEGYFLSRKISKRKYITIYFWTSLYNSNNNKHSNNNIWYLLNKYVVPVPVMCGLLVVSNLIFPKVLGDKHYCPFILQIKKMIYGEVK